MSHYLGKYYRVTEVHFIIGSVLQNLSYIDSGAVSLWISYMAQILSLIFLVLIV